MSESTKAVFLSYASQDAGVALRICEALRAAGVEVWFDQSELRGGDAWDQKIRRQIRECALFVPVISVNTQARAEGYFRLEWHLAEQRSHLIARGRPFIVPVAIDQTNDTDALVPDAFLAVQWMRVSGGEVSAAFCDRVKKLLGSDESVGRDRRIPPPPATAGSGDPALQKRSASRRSSLPRLLLGGLAILVAGAVAYLVLKPRRSPEEIAKIITEAQALAEKTAARAMSATKPAASPAPSSPAVSASKPLSELADALPKGAKPLADQKSADGGQASSAVPSSLSPPGLRSLGEAGTPSTLPVPDSKSVAVLAFANLSDDKENEYFSDGISEELLTVLQKIPGLHVAARTSAFSFKGKNVTAQEIGQKLGVANLVEGSVRKAGNSVRISARLSRADTGEQLWSDSYTRDLKDVFAVQSEIALTILEQLRGQLGGGTGDAAAKAAILAQVQAAEKGGTKNTEAHQQYLRGKFFSNQFSQENFARAAEHFHQAVELDPSFALAWAALARTSALQAEYGNSLKDFTEGIEQARKATDRALALEPNLAEGLSARMEIQTGYDFDWRGARESVRQALALAPADAMLISNAARLAGFFGELEKSIELGRQAADLDPVNPEIRHYLAGNLSNLGRYREAEVERRRAIELSPSLPWGHAGLAADLLQQGKPEPALIEAEQEKTEWARLTVLAMVHWTLKNSAKADATLARLIELTADIAAYQITEVYAYRRETDAAFQWLERAYRQHDSGLAECKCDPFLANLHHDPRWPDFLRKLGLADDQLK
jgi:TolB-like protein/tetratricopeptide (TPR) repeat protein